MDRHNNTPRLLKTVLSTHDADMSREVPVPVPGRPRSGASVRARSAARGTAELAPLTAHLRWPSRCVDRGLAGRGDSPRSRAYGPRVLAAGGALGRGAARANV